MKYAIVVYDDGWTVTADGVSRTAVNAPPDADPRSVFLRVARLPQDFKEDWVKVTRRTETRNVLEPREHTWDRPVYPTDRLIDENGHWVRSSGSEHIVETLPTIVGTREAAIVVWSWDAP